MRWWFRLVSLALAFGLFACGGQGEYRKTGGTFAGRGPHCDYQVLRSRILEPYEEIGVIDIDAFSMGQMPDNEERFRHVVGPYVCAAGGEAVIPTINIYGHWVIGSVIRFNPVECKPCNAEDMKDAGG